MITVCAASRRLTLSSALQRIYSVEVAGRRLENPVVTHYKRQQLFAPVSTIPCASSWLSQRPFSTSPVYATKTVRGNKERSSTSVKVPRKNRSDDGVLAELTSTKADKTSKRSKKTNDSKKTIGSRRTNNSRRTKDSKIMNDSKRTKDSEFKSAKSKPNLKIANKGNEPSDKLLLKYTVVQQKQKLEPWQVQKKALQEKFEEGWHPRKKLSPDTLDTIRHLNATKPRDWTTRALADHFKVSPEAIRRILKSKWQPSDDERQKRQERWHKRHERLWSHMEQLGLRPTKGERTAKLSDARRLGLESPPSSSP